jgi:hypothetical protein
VRALVGADIVRGDLVDVADVEGAVVGEVEVQLAIALERGVHREDLVEVRYDGHHALLRALSDAQRRHTGTRDQPLSEMPKA